MMRAWMMMLLVVFGAMQYKLWFGDANPRAIWVLDKKITRVETANQKQLIRNARIESDIQDLRSGEQALEARARYELGMIKEGEQFYQFIN